MRDKRVIIGIIQNKRRNLVSQSRTIDHHAIVTAISGSPTVGDGDVSIDARITKGVVDLLSKMLHLGFIKGDFHLDIVTFELRGKTSEQPTIAPTNRNRPFGKVVIINGTTQFVRAGRPKLIIQSGLINRKLFCLSTVFRLSDSIIHI